MEIERNTQGNVRTQSSSDAADELAVGVECALGDRRTVLREQDCVPRALLTKQPEQLVRKPLERIGRHDPHRVRLCERERHDVEAEPL